MMGAGTCWWEGTGNCSLSARAQGSWTYSEESEGPSRILSMMQLCRKTYWLWQRGTASGFWAGMGQQGGHPGPQPHTRQGRSRTDKRAIFEPSRVSHSVKAGRSPSLLPFYRKDPRVLYSSP